MSEKSDKVLVDAILAVAGKEGDRLGVTCPEAMQLAGEHSVKPAEITRLCNEHGVKIRKCQLGCF